MIMVITPLQDKCNDNRNDNYTITGLKEHYSETHTVIVIVITPLQDLKVITMRTENVMIIVIL